MIEIERILNGDEGQGVSPLPICLTFRNGGEESEKPENSRFDCLEMTQLSTFCLVMSSNLFIWKPRLTVFKSN